MNALFSLSDLNPEFDGEPRLRDLTVADRLGFTRPRDILKLIAVNRAELETHGTLVCANTPQTSEGGRPGAEFWLNEAQTLLVCMFSRTAVAAEVRRAVIEVFMTWRRGELPPIEDGQLPAEDLRGWLKMVSETRMLFGKASARRLWLASPLPRVDGMDDPDAVTPDHGPDLDPRGCLDHLLGWVPPGMGAPVADLLARVDDAETARALRRRGLVADPKGRDGWLAVSTAAPDLIRLYAGTRWRDRHGAALLTLPGARRHPGTVRFHAISRAVLIPLSLMVGEGNCHAQ